MHPRQEIIHRERRVEAVHTAHGRAIDLNVAKISDSSLFFVFDRIAAKKAVGIDRVDADYPVWSKNSCSFAVIEFEQAAEAIAGLDLSRCAANPVGCCGQ